MKILIVEDDETTRRLIARILEQEGHEVSQAFTAQGAILCLSADPPDVVLLDIVLGDRASMNGWVVAGYMQTDSRLRRSRVIITSGLPPEEIRAGAMSYVNTLADASLIFGKPIDVDALLRALATFERDRDPE